MRPTILSLALGQLSRDEYALNLHRKCSAVERAPRFGYQDFGALQVVARSERQSGALTGQKITPLSRRGARARTHSREGTCVYQTGKP